MQQIVAVGERANAMKAVDFLNKRGANVKFCSIAEPPSESDWHSKGATSTQPLQKITETPADYPCMPVLLKSAIFDMRLETFSSSYNAALSHHCLGIVAAESVG